MPGRFQNKDTQCSGTRRCAVVGATGLVGGALAGELVRRPEYASIRTVGRRAPDLTGAGVSHVIADLADACPGDALSADTVFCCLGTTIRTAGSKEAFRQVDYGMVVNIARQARAAGAGTFIVVSSLGADATSRNFYQRTKGDMEAVVMAVGFDRLAILRPSLLLGARDEFRLMEAIGKLASQLVNPLLPGGLARYRSIHADTVARAMVAVDLADFTGTRILESDEIARMGAR